MKFYSSTPYPKKIVDLIVYFTIIQVYISKHRFIYFISAVEMNIH